MLYILRYSSIRLIRTTFHSCPKLLTILPSNSDLTINKFTVRITQFANLVFYYTAVLSQIYIWSNYTNIAFSNQQYISRLNTKSKIVNSAYIRRYLCRYPLLIDTAKPRKRLSIDTAKPRKGYQYIMNNYYPVHLF